MKKKHRIDENKIVVLLNQRRSNHSIENGHDWYNH